MGGEGRLDHLGPLEGQVCSGRAVEQALAATEQHRGGDDRAA